MIWLPAGGYVFFAYIDVQYVPPAFFDELERSGREALAQTEMTRDGRTPNGSANLEWRRVPGAIEDVITLNAHCADFTIVSHSNPNESAQSGLVASPASTAPGANRPVLGALYVGLRQTPGKCVTTAWNAGRAALTEAAKNSIDVSDVLLSQVSDAESDFLAMGTHGHTHAHED